MRRKHTFGHIDETVKRIGDVVKQREQTLADVVEGVLDRNDLTASKYAIVRTQIVDAVERHLSLVMGYLVDVSTSAEAFTAGHYCDYAGAHGRGCCEALARFTVQGGRYYCAAHLAVGLTAYHNTHGGNDGTANDNHAQQLGSARAEQDEAG